MIVGTAIGLVLGLFFASYFAGRTIERKEREYERKISRLKNDIYFWKSSASLERARGMYKSRETVDQVLMRDAAKKAMFHSHPDHSGDPNTAEDFIRFKELYDSLR